MGPTVRRRNCPWDDPFLISFRNTVRTWFSPPILNCTAFSAFARLEYLAADLKNRSEAIHKLYEIAPLQDRVAELELISRYSEHPTYAQVQQIMGPMLDYYLPALNWAAKASDLNFDDRITLQKKAAALDPQRYRALARDFLSRGRASEAAAHTSNGLTRARTVSLFPTRWNGSSIITTTTAKKARQWPLPRTAPESIHGEG